MLHQEQIQKRRSRSRDAQPVSTFPEVNRKAARGSGGPDGTDELLERIDRELEESTARALGEAAGIGTE